MALFKILGGDKSRLATQEIVEGRVWVTKDEHAMYVDVKDSSGTKSRIKLYDSLENDISDLQASITGITNNFNNKTNISVMPNDNGDIKTKYRIAQKGNTASATWYYPLFQFPVNNAGNYASAIISGRLGGWTSDNMSYISALCWNRDTPGITTIDLGARAGASSTIYSIGDLVLYVDGTSSTAAATATLYVKCKGYFAFDLNLELFQSSANIIYDGSYLTVTPSGTLVTQASTTSQRVEIINGKLSVNGKDVVIVDEGNAGSATKLKTARTINGTAFDGTQDIVTTKWGTARAISTKDSSGTNISKSVTWDGSTTLSVYLPETIKGKFEGSLTGNATSADAFSSNKTISLTGDITGSAAGTASWSIATSLIDSGVTAGGYGPTGTKTLSWGDSFIVPYVKVDKKGRVISALAYNMTLPKIDAAERLGTIDVGSTTTPIFLTEGKATACSGVVVTSSAQTFSGDKTFSNNLIGNGNITLTTGGIVAEKGTIKGSQFQGSSAILTGTVKAGSIDASTVTSQNIELNNGSYPLNSYGGFIDFHYRNASGKFTDATGTEVTSSVDYTSRIIEDAPGQITINGVKFKSSVVTGSFVGSLSGNASSATRATQDGNGAVISSTYETKADASNKLIVAKNYTDTLATKVNTLIGSDSNKSVRTIANEELVAQLIPESAKESLDTLEEIAAWIQNHPDDAAAMNLAISNKMDKVNPTGSGNVSIGRASNTTVGTDSIVIGTGSKATASNAVAIGSYNSATNARSIVLGTSSTASGVDSVALGSHNTATNEFSFAVGCWTTAKGIASTAMGNGSVANSWGGLSAGIQTSAVGKSQFVFGNNNIADTLASGADYTTKTDHLFILGNGDEDTGVKSNAMTVDWSGNAWFSGDVYVGSTSGTNKDDGSKKLITGTDLANSVKNSAPTLSWGTTSTIGTINGVALTVKMPVNPNTNTAHSHSVGTGLTISGSGGTSGTTTYAANLKSTTSLGTLGTTTKLYAVGVDANGKLAVSVPWTDTNTTYGVATSSAAGLMSPSDKSKLDNITASADAVSFSPSLTSGTKVGTITINGTSTALYAPTNTDTHYVSGTVVGSSTSATSNTTSALTNGNVYVNHIENGSVKNSHKISGSGATTVTSDTSGNIIVSSTNTTYGVATSSSLGLVKSGTDITVDSSGNVSVNDDSHNHTSLKCLGAKNPEMERTAARGGVYSYITNAAYHENAPTTYTSVIGFGAGTSGHSEIASGWTSGRGLWYRNLRDTVNEWFSWYRVLDQANYTDYTVEKNGSGATGTWGISITGNAVTATTATKLGSSTVGGTAKPIYLNSGTATACSATVGSSNKPVYMNAGTITACSSTVGNGVQPVYMNAGTITGCTMSTSGNRWNVLTKVTDGGVLLGGKYLNFYATAGASDAAFQLTASAGLLTASGKLSLPTSTNSYINGGMSLTKASININTTQTTGSYHPVINLKTSSGHYLSQGGIADSYGFYGFLSSRTENGCDWFKTFSVAKGTITHTSTVSGGAQYNMNGIGDVCFTASNYSTGNKVGLLLGSGGYNRGVYDFTNSCWAFYVDSNKHYNVGPGGTVYAYSGVLYGACWNDYAEFRAKEEVIEPGYCVASRDDGKVYKTIEKLQACDGIVSDTYGFVIGDQENETIPLAVAGRVLAYCEGDRKSYHAGDTVCAGPGGKVVKMTREEICMWPDRIVGIVSEIPEYEIWGTNDIEVNGRIWIKVR